MGKSSAMDYNKLCSEILKLTSKIRFAGVYSSVNGKVYSKQSDRIDRIVSEDQTYQTLVHAYMRWKTRQGMSDTLGEPIYAMAKYPTINRITLRCGEKSILMISTDQELEPPEIVDDVLKLIEKFADAPEYVTAPSIHRYQF